MRPWHFALILIAVVGLVFGEVRNMDFVDYDDNVNVYSNPDLNPPTAQSLQRLWTQPSFGAYIPVTRTAWLALAWIAVVPPNPLGLLLQPMPFHVANLLVHCLNVLVVFAVLRLLVGLDWPAFAGAALFALHPVQVEPVCWVTGMKDLLSGLFGLLAVWGHLACARRQESGAACGLILRAGPVALLTLAVLAKPTVIGVILVAWGLDHLVIGRDWRTVTRALLPWAAVALAAAVSAKIINGPAAETVPVWGRPIIAADALAFYLGKLVWPVRLCADYARGLDLVLSSWWGYVTWLAPAAVGVALVRRRGRYPVLAAAGLVFGAALLPYLGLVPFPKQDVADRYMYLALLGPALALAWGLGRAKATRLNAAALLLLAVLAVGSSFQTLHWHATSVLFERVVQVNPRSWVAHTALANHLLRSGRPSEAYGHLTMAVRANPEHADAYQALGAYYQARGQSEQAIASLRRAVNLEPDNGLGRLNLGTALSSAGRDEEALVELREALRLDPDAWQAHDGIGTVLGAMGRHEEAAEHFRECIRLRPDYPSAYLNLVAALVQLGREDEAAQVIAQARARWPQLPAPPR